MNKKRNIYPVLLSAMLGTSTVLSPMSYINVSAQTQRVAATYSHPEMITVTNGNNFLDASSEVSKFTGISDFTYNTTFTCTGSSVNALFFIGDSTKPSNYVSVYLNGKTLGVESRNASGAQQISGGTVALNNLDLTQEHKLTFVLHGGSKFAFYVDGVKVKEGNTSAKFTEGVIANPNFIGFGKGNRSNNQNNYPFTGTQKNIELYNTALTDEEILDYHSEKEREDLVYKNSGNYFTEKSVYEPITNTDTIQTLKELDRGTISVRYRAESATSGLMSLFSLSDGNENGKYFSFYVNPSTNTLGVEVLGGTESNGNYAITPANTPALNTNGINDSEWHTLTVTKAKEEDTNRYVMFLDGVRLNHFGYKTGFLNGIDTADSVGIGFTNRAAGNEYNFKGAIDSVKVYSSVLTNAEIKAEHDKIAYESTQVEDLENVYKTTPETLFYPGYDESGAYRIPALLQTKEGTVLAATDRRNTGTGDAGNIDITVRRREAGAKDFGDPIEIIDLTDNNRVTPSAFLIDSSFTSYKYEENGEEKERIIMFVDMFPESIGLMNKEILETGTGFKEVNGKQYQIVRTSDNKDYTIRENGVVYDEKGEPTDYTIVTECEAPYKELGNIYKNGEYKGNAYIFTGKDKGELNIVRTQYLWMTYSDDDGKTWANPKNITPQVKEDWMLFLGTGPGVGIQLEDGSLAVPVYSAGKANLNGSQASALIISKDGGETWELGQSPVAVAGYDRETMNNGSAMLTESQVIQLNNGDVKLFMRCYGGKTKVATSTDGGMTWDRLEALDDVYNSYCQLSVIKYDKDGKEYIVLVTPGKNGRQDGTVYYGEVQEDGTITWSSKLLYKGHFQYSSIEHLGTDENGYEKFGVLFEADIDGVDGNIGQFYTEFDERWITSETVASVQQNPVLMNKEVTKEGNKLTVKLQFDQVMMAAGAPTLTLQVGNDTVNASYISGTGTDTLTFEAYLDETLTGVVKAVGIDETNGIVENTINGKVSINEVVYDLTQVKENVTIEDYSSQHSDSTAEGQDGAARNVLDGNPKTYWHSTWGNSAITLPQWVTLDLGETKNIYKLSYLPRQNSQSGRVKNYEILGSTDGVNYSVLTTGTFNTSGDLQYAEFIPSNVRYIRFKVLSSTAETSCTVAELNVFEYADGVIELGDKTKLQNLVDSLSAYHASDYTAASWAFVETNKEKAETLLNADVVSQIMLDNTYDSLALAKKRLVSMERANELKQRVEALNESDYTAESWQVFEEAIADLDERMNAALTNKQITDVIYKTNYDISLLVEDVHRADYSEVDRLIALVEELDASKYTAQSYEAVMDAVEAVERGLEASRQEEVDAMAEAIQSAIDALVREYAVLVNGEEAARGVYNERVTVKAPVVEGKEFTAWLFNGKVISTEAEYTFFLSEDMELTPCYEAVEMNAEALLTNTMLVKRADAKADIKFVAQLVVPTGYTVKDAGLVWSSKEGTELSLENKNLKPTYITRISNTNQFSVTIKGMPAGRFIRGRIFATLVDSEGNESVVYSDETRVVNK